MDNEEKSTYGKIKALKDQRGLAVVEKSYDVLDAMQDFAIRVARDEKATPAELEALAGIAGHVLAFG